jgi:hypothetical protein
MLLGSAPRPGRASVSDLHGHLQLYRCLHQACRASTFSIGPLRPVRIVHVERHGSTIRLFIVIRTKGNDEDEKDMTHNYPIPDRTNFRPNFQKTEENDVLDIGWAEGVLSDGRPYRFECWCQDQITDVTIFLSRIGLEDLDKQEIIKLLEQENLLHFPSPRQYVSARPFRDPSGHDLPSINAVIGDQEEIYATGGPNLNSYVRPDS